MSSQVKISHPDPPLDQDTASGPEGESSMWNAEIDPAVNAQIIQTYSDVWDEFYDWDQETCRAEISSLSADISSSGQIFHLGSQDEDALDFHFEESIESSDDAMEVDDLESSSFIIHDLSKHEARTVVCAKKNLTYHPAHPKYYACTPTSCNIAPVKNSKAARFVPFDGDTGFDTVAYLRMDQWSSFVWQDSWIDPNGISCLVLKSLMVISFCVIQTKLL